jgi:hypothetical protein
MNRYDALAGALVADAASMGLHWLYDQEQIETVASTGDIMFRQPEAAVFKDKKGYFAHALRRAGQLSHYGESARIVGQLAADGEYETTLHRQRFFETFGPCGHYSGYADRPTKMLVARMINEGDDITEPSGMDDNQMPAICVVPGLFAYDYSADTINKAAQVISTNVDVVAGAAAVQQCLNYLSEGQTLTDALRLSANAMSGKVGPLMKEALTIEQYKPLEAAKQFGLACYVEHSLPVVWYLLNHARDFESVVRDNIRCGGDNCGRTMALGAIAGLAFGVPDSLVRRMDGGRIPIIV